MPWHARRIAAEKNQLKQWWTTWKGGRMIEAGFLHVLIPVALIVCAVLVAVFKDLLYSVVVLAVLSLLLAVEYYILKAPDVAIAEAGIGAAVTAAIFIITIRATKRME
jgi:energy-converting hydrogenase B subunit D